MTVILLAVIAYLLAILGGAYLLSLGGRIPKMRKVPRRMSETLKTGAGTRRRKGSSIIRRNLGKPTFSQNKEGL